MPGPPLGDPRLSDQINRVTWGSLLSLSLPQWAASCYHVFCLFSTQELATWYSLGTDIRLTPLPAMEPTGVEWTVGGGVAFWQVWWTEGELSLSWVSGIFLWNNGGCLGLALLPHLTQVTGQGAQDL